VTAPKAPTLRYVLSAGRTGTVFLERLINGRLAGATAAHEPAATRYQMMLANLRNDWGLGGGHLKRIFERSRDRRLNAAGGVYVEINPFLCAMTDLLPRPGSPLRIVHMVRDPASWAASITTFKASNRFRGVIDHIPFAKPYPAPRPRGWRDLDAYERALWRWNWCNRRVGDLSPLAEAYAVVRYEDLFSATDEARARALSTIAATLGLPGQLEFRPGDMDVRANASDGDGPGMDREAARRICGELARGYGYDY
jgi:hypothetical protein